MRLGDLPTSEILWALIRKDLKAKYMLFEQEVDILKELALGQSLIKLNAGIEINTSKPQYRPFTRPISECIRLKQGTNACPVLIGVQPVVEKALAVICREIEKVHDAAGAYRKPPLVLSALARGGKTTTLCLIFDELKKRGYNAMIISFNSVSKFTRQPNESQSHAILRRITEQLVDEDAPDAQSMACDKAALDEYISTHNFVLLIDEINGLGSLDADATALLREIFLNKKGRYLVITTHVEISLDEPAFASTELGIRSGRRPCLTVPLPCTYELAPLRQMSPDCSTLTPLQIAYLGGIPSLIYSTHVNKEDSPSIRFRSQRIFIEPADKMRILAAFVEEFLTGKRITGRSALFDMFSVVPEHNRMRWPLCYVICIIDLFSSKLTSYLSPLKKCLNNLEVFSALSDSGKDWEVIIEIALLFRFYANMLSDLSVPLGLLEPTQRATHVQYISMPGDCDTLDKAHKFIASNVTLCTKPTLILFSPLLTKFPVFDGFAVFTERDEDGHRSTVISGYQARKGTSTPVAAVPAWVNGGGWLLRGKAAATEHLTESGWIYMTEQDICDEILGYSLAPIYPAVANW